MTSTTPKRLRATTLGAVLAAALLGLAPQASAVTPQPPSADPGSRAAAHEAAAAPATLSTLSRFFAREGKVALTAARPRIEGAALPVHYLSPEFVAGKAGAPVARLEFLVSKAVASDGQLAALWTAKTDRGWQVVNIATGDDEFRYAAQGARTLPGGTVFREPQIDAWYVAKGSRVLPLDQDAVRVVGSRGTTLAAYRTRVAKAYGGKLPGSAYAKAGKAGGYAPTVAAPAPQDSPSAVPLAAGATGGALALGALGALALRRTRRTATARG
ncbi:hypothetical protein [Streptomyces sp. NBC_00239]|uniref:hypothetical protein n=1 Tax=Streptomyces sp. NBC_00239 TaxID=2903640 RepID=UPI002E294217|nr:hypothetical protein [Streptomyces sp. NBC_00239]